MKKRLFKNMFIVTAVTTLISMLSVLLLVFPLVERELTQELREEADMISRGLELSGEAYLDGFSDKDRRVTIIKPDGGVEYDSGNNIKELDNHLNREEIESAFAKGEGVSVRFSNTLTTRTINYAKKIKDGRVIRISVEQKHIVTLLLWLLPPVCILLAVIIFLSIIAAKNSTNRILKPLYEIDPENPESLTGYEELRPLTDKIRDQNQKLKEKIYKDLEKKHHKQNEFMSNMTHELKTPLTSISGFAELMMDEGMDQATIRDFAGSIHDEAGRLIQLVNDIIRLAELDEREGNYVFEDIELDELILNVTESLSVSAKKKHVNIIYENNPVSVYGVYRVVHEMIYNLVDNAVKYNKDNGSIFISTENSEEGVRISIADTGIGIPNEEQENIFERFYRVDHSHSNDIEGTGLGLSIVQQGALLHKAGVYIDSNENEGTRITLVFPNYNIYKTGGHI